MSLPIEEGLIVGLAPGAEGQIYYTRRPAARPAGVRKQSRSRHFAASI